MLAALFELVPGEPEPAEFAARGLAHCARAAARDEGLEPAARAARERDYATAALEALRAAADAGHVAAVQELLVPETSPRIRILLRHVERGLPAPDGDGALEEVGAALGALRAAAERAHDLLEERQRLARPTSAG